MSSRKKKKKTKSRQPEKKTRRKLKLLLAFLLSIGILVTLFWLGGGGPATDFERLAGKWIRTDGGYVIEIREVLDDGEMEAGYFNPNPIRVSKARASRQGNETRVAIELRDVNYPGSTYTLDYDRDRDVLEGIYYQAALQQSFNVRFVRMD
jgi:hypothetical protein